MNIFSPGKPSADQELESTGISADMRRLLGIKPTTAAPAQRVAARGDSHFNALASVLGVPSQQLSQANPKLQTDSYGNVANGQVVQSGSGQSAYVVRAGEGLHGVARRLGTSIHSLIDSNGHIANFNRLHAGDILFFRSGGYNDPMAHLAYQHSVSVPVLVSCHEHVRSAKQKNRHMGSLSAEAAQEYLTTNATAKLDIYNFLGVAPTPTPLQQLILYPQARATASGLWLARLRAQIPAYINAARAVPVLHNNALLAASFIDLYIQSSKAADHFMQQLPYLSETGISQLSLTELRVRAFIDVDSGQRHVSDTDNVYAKEAAKRFGANSTEAHIQKIIIQNQVQRVSEVRKIVDTLDENTGLESRRIKL
jgi:LysM domain